jgi:hypothetical protein
MKLHDDMGLVTEEGSHALQWTRRGVLWWLPDAVLSLIVRTWNPIACRVWGHRVIGPFADDDGEVVCPRMCYNCSKEFP